MNFEIVDEIQEVEIIAAGKSIQDRARLKKIYGTGRWRKLKGIAHVRLQTGKTRLAELRWYGTKPMVLGRGTSNESGTWTDARNRAQGFSSTICGLHRQLRLRGVPGTAQDLPRGSRPGRGPGWGPSNH